MIRAARSQAGPSNPDGYSLLFQSFTTLHSLADTPRPAETGGRGNRLREGRSLQGHVNLGDYTDDLTTPSDGPFKLNAYHPSGKKTRQIFSGTIFLTPE